MDTRQLLHELIYVSFLSPGTAVNAVADIATASRAANKSWQITGVLVFDGERFCQYLEGAVDEVARLFERISVDVRHVHVQLLHRGAIDTRRFHQFSMGYADVMEVDVIGTLSGQRDIAARDAFLRLSGTIDFGV